ncbi:MAG: hypothetical protein ACRDHL_15325 [Candidatus Promineifilaceae bacterium]
MLLIEHRVNTVEKLLSVPAERGVEVDVRELGGELRLAHDPYECGQRLEDLLRAYHHALIIFNVKCDGLEERILALAAEHEIEQFFFLDLAPATLIRLAQAGLRQAAVRFSEFEPVEAALELAGRVEWVWVDCFSRRPLDRADYQRLRPHFKLCLVSPELQGLPRAELAGWRRALAGMPIDAVCSDLCDEWAAGGVG